MAHHFDPFSVCPQESTEDEFGNARLCLLEEPLVEVLVCAIDQDSVTIAHGLSSVWFGVQTIKSVDSPRWEASFDWR